jgi:hypothetical protein
LQSLIVDPPSLLRVDPLVLATAGRQVAASATVLREALPSLDAAWIAASQVLARYATGGALQDCRPALRLALDSCVKELVAVSATLGEASVVYDQAEGAAVPVVR